MTKIIVGIGFLGLGFIGLFLPVLQGVLFMLVGLAILSTESRRVRRLRDEIKRRHPGPWRQAQALRDRMKARFGVAERHDKETTGDEGASDSAS
jgi:uncharacterized membrane protein YbaN (DUF454 family)